MLVVNVKPGISTTDLRAKGFEQEAKRLGLTYVGQQFTNDDPAKAASIVSAELAKNPDLKGIFATNLFSAEGSRPACARRASWARSRSSASTPARSRSQDLKDGVVQALIAQKPAEIGVDGVQQAYNALSGKASEKKIGTGFTSVTKDNLASEPGRALQVELLSGLRWRRHGPAPPPPPARPSRRTRRPRARR